MCRFIISTLKCFKVHRLTLLPLLLLLLSNAAAGTKNSSFAFNIACCFACPLAIGRGLGRPTARHVDGSAADSVSVATFFWFLFSLSLCVTSERLEDTVTWVWQRELKLMWRIGSFRSLVLFLTIEHQTFKLWKYSVWGLGFIFEILSESVPEPC